MANFLDNGGKVDYTAPHIGAVAQLGERCVRNAEVRGSIPLSSTNKKATRHGWFFIGGKKDFLRGLNTWPWVRGAKSKTTDAPVVWSHAAPFCY